MRTFFLIMIAIMLLVVSFAAFFPNFTTAMYLAFGNQFWASPSTGHNPTGNNADELRHYLFWFIGALSFFAAIGLFVRAFGR